MKHRTIKEMLLEEMYRVNGLTEDLQFMADDAGVETASVWATHMKMASIAFKAEDEEAMLTAYNHLKKIESPFSAQNLKNILLNK